MAQSHLKIFNVVLLNRKRPRCWYSTWGSTTVNVEVVAAAVFATTLIVATSLCCCCCVVATVV